MKKLFIGTSGYSYKEWVGPIYPKTAKSGDFLKLYAREFNIVELNFSYYRQPEARTISKMVETTGDDFLFCIKAHKSLTHEIKGDLLDQAAKFKEGILPLIEASKLGAVLLQFPYSFHYNIENRKYLQKLYYEFENLPLAIEFRNSEWLKDSVYNTLENLDMALVCLDEPDLPRLIKPSDRVTAHFSYIRFHGRNKKMWWSGDNRTRYDYLYSEEELCEWIPRIESIIEKVNILFIFFNNHYKGQAVINARRLKELLGLGLK